MRKIFKTRDQGLSKKRTEETLNQVVFYSIFINLLVKYKIVLQNLFNFYSNKNKNQFTITLALHLHMLYGKQK